MTLELLVQPYRERINGVLEKALANAPAGELQQAMRYALLLGGKRIRPVFTYLVGEALSANSTDLDRAAAAVECIHAYSLIHDDLPAMDDDALRRGQPTVHIAFTEATAILAGDALQTLAFEILSQPAQAIPAQRQLAMLHCLAVASGSAGMCGGQALDLAATGQQQSQAQLEQMHQLKTGALISAAIQLAVLSANDDAQAFYTDFTAFGQAIGLAFQVQDDILDVTASTAVLGKAQGADTAAGKSTYVQLLGLAGAQQQMQHLHDKALQALAGIPYNTDKLAQLANLLLTRDH